MEKKSETSTHKSIVPIKKMARICWNGSNVNGKDWLKKNWTTNKWMSPSGPKGKSTSPHAYECQNGFGMEEWLQPNPSRSKFSSGYHYAFLQQFNSDSNTYAGKIYHIELFAVSPYRLNGKKKVMLHVGRINKAEVLDQNGQHNAYNDPIGKSWMVDMQQEVGRLSGANFPPQNRPKEWFNVRFKPKDLVLFNKAKVLDPNCIKNYRYVLMDYKGFKYMHDPKTGKIITVSI